MKTVLKILFLLSMGFHQTGFGQDSPSPHLVVIDPGHGGTDSGAIGAQRVLEKDIVLQVSKEMVRLNREIYGSTMKLYLTRYSDTLISLRDRSRLARTLKADVYLSIHCNQAQKTGAQGIEVFVAKSKGRYREASLQLANAIGKNLNQHLSLKDRGIKQANFHVLRETAQLCPSVLIELGFLSNRVEEAHLNKKPSLSAMALVILETLNAYFDEGNHQ